MTYEEQLRAIDEQIEALKKTTEKALRSKATAIKYLRDTGILELIKKSSPPKKRK